MFKNILMVAAGGSLGSVCRYLMSVFIRKVTVLDFPLSTFIVNILGSFLAGFIFKRLAGMDNEGAWLLLLVGFCGGFTTFSSFTLENLLMIQSGQSHMAAVYISISLLCGLLALYAGILIASKI